MDSMVTARVPAEIKKRANRAYEKLGVTPSQAINFLYEYVADKQCLPDFRSEEQKLFEGKERVLDPETMTPKMKKKVEAILWMRNRPPVDFGEDAGKTVREIMEERWDERSETLLGHKCTT